MLQTRPGIMREKRRLTEYTAPVAVKRTRSFTDFDYEEMLCTMATMVEDLCLLLDVVADICVDKHCCYCRNDSIGMLRCKLHAIENTVMDNETCSLKAVQNMCIDMFAVIKYLMGVHYNDLSRLGLDHLVMGTRNQFAQFMIHYSLN